MAKIRLQGEEALRYLQQNPNARFTDNITGATYGQQAQAAEPGLFSNLLRGITSPFRKGVGVAAEFGDTLSDLIKLSQGRTDLEEEDLFSAIQRGVLSEEERRQLERDPLQTGLKSGAGVLSFALPAGAAGATTAGGRIAQAAGRGALAGGVGGFGYSEEGEELQSILKGGALGGVLGGALQGVGELARAANKTGKLLKKSGQEGFDKLALEDAKVLDDKSLLLKEIESQMKGVGRDQLDSFPISASMVKKLGYSPQELSKLKTEVVRDMSQRGFAVNTAEDLANSLRDYRGALSQEKAQILATVGNRQMVGTGEVTKSLKRFSSIVGENKAATRMLNDEISTILGKGYSIDKMPKRMTMNQVVKLKEVVDDIAGGFDKVMAADSSSVVSGQLLKKVRDSSRGVLTGNKNLDRVLEKMSNTYKLEPAILEAPMVSQNLVQKATTQTNRQIGSLGIKRAQELSKLADEARALEASNQIGLKIPLTDTSIPLPVNPRSIGSSVQYGAGRVLEGIPELSFLINAGQRAIPAMTYRGGEVALPQELQQQPIQQQPVGQQPGIEGLNLILAQGILSGQISAAEANAVLSLLGMGGDTEKRTEKQNLFSAAARAAGDALALLESGQAKTGKVQNIGSKFGEFFGSQDPMQTEYYANLDSARGAALSALSGANVPPSEYERLRRFIPEPTDEYNIAVQKLRNFQEQMLNYAGQGGAAVDSGSLMQTLGY